MIRAESSKIKFQMKLQPLRNKSSVLIKAVIDIAFDWN